LFSGIGGFDKGFHDAGMRSVWAVEKEPFCRAVLRTHFPQLEIFEDVRSVGKHNLKPVDVISAGVPCQDVSVAGKRAGLAGERTGLFYEFARVLRELRPTWFTFENVPGLLSSNGGRDFAEVLRVLMVECGYGVCWRVLNSQFFGVAQRRNRLFLVGRSGKPCSGEILFEASSGDRAATKSKEAGSRLIAEANGGIVGCLAARDYKGADNIFAEEGKLVPIAFGANDDGRDETVNLAPTLRCGGIGGGGVHTAVVFESRYFRNGRGAPGKIVPCLRAETGRTGKGDAAPMVCAPADANRVRDFAELPPELDAPRYRALGNAVTTKVSQWIGRRIVETSTEQGG
jgi:site-specific DNA-cytosine methylase